MQSYILVYSSLKRERTLESSGFSANFCVRGTNRGKEKKEEQRKKWLDRAVHCFKN